MRMSIYSLFVFDSVSCFFCCLCQSACLNLRFAFLARSRNMMLVAISAFINTLPSLLALTCPLLLAIKQSYAALMLAGTASLFWACNAGPQQIRSMYNCDPWHMSRNIYTEIHCPPPIRHATRMPAASASPPPSGGGASNYLT